MDRVLAFVEIRNGEIQPISFEILGAARQLADALGARVDALALGFIVARLAYVACYLADQASLRSVVWMVGLGLSIALFVVAA